MEAGSEKDRLKMKEFRLSQISRAKINVSSSSSPLSLARSCCRNPLPSVSSRDNFCTLLHPSCQTTIEELHCQRMWKIDSGSLEQIGQKGFSVTCFQNNTTMVGRRSWATLQTKFLKVPGAFKLHNHVQNSEFSC
jgi:hypothetical protein